MDAFWLIKSRFSLFGTKLAWNQQNNYSTFLMIFVIFYLDKFISSLWFLDVDDESTQVMIYESRCVYDIHFNVLKSDARMHVILDAHTLDVLFFHNVAQTSGSKNPDQANSGCTSSNLRNKYIYYHRVLICVVVNPKTWLKANSDKFLFI